MDLQKESDGEDDTNRVLEYYKKYTQNPDLSKYFTGPEAALVKKSSASKSYRKEPQIRYDTPLTHSEVGTSNLQPSDIVIEVNQDQDIENKNISPSSSIASIKKLEWDNGADIGYKNSYKLSTKKSASFPSLFTNDLSVKSTKFINLSEEKSISENIQELRKMYHQLTFSSETSCSPTKENEIITSSSSTSPPKEQTPPDLSSSQNEPILKDYEESSTGSSSNHLLYLQKRIGFPVANSTPNEELSSKSSEKDGYRETPIVRGQDKPKRNLNANKKFEYSDQVDNKEKINLIESDCKDSKEFKNTLNDQAQPKNVGNQELVQKLSKIQRQVNLCLTKPIFVECLSSGSKESVNKVSQTTFSLEKSSKSIQTDTPLSKSKIVHQNPVRVCSPQTQKIEFVQFKNDEINSTSKSTETISNNNNNSKLEISVNYAPVKKVQKKISKENGQYLKDRIQETSTNTSDDVIDNQSEYKVARKTTNVGLSKKEIYSNNKRIVECEDMEPVKEERNSSQSAKISSSVSISAGTSDNSDLQNVGLSEIPTNKKSAESVHESCSEEIILAEMISLKHSRNLNTDIKRSIDILQKLLKSKKYDQATKKHYIKKIVQKIVESKYSDDSTTSSELFRPRKVRVETKINQDREIQKDDITQVKPDDKIEIVHSEVKLMDNIPWYPVVQQKTATLRNKTKNLDCKVTKTEILTNVRNIDKTFEPATRDDPDLIRIRETMPPKDFKFPSNLQMMMTNGKRTNTNSLRTSVFPPKEFQSSDDLIHKKTDRQEAQPTTSGVKIDDKNWKSSKTLSERLLENRERGGLKLGQGDYLLHVATNERQHQLSWINNEIEHLVKLKQMLEKKAKPEGQINDVINSLLKMKVDDMRGLSKNVEVFVCKCTETKGKCDRNCVTKKSTTNGKSRKKSASLTPGYYTIETQLDPEGNLLDLTVFDEKGTKKYNYRNDGAVDDVLVKSSNHNTKVKLRPRSEDYAGRTVPSPYKVCKVCGRLFLPPVNNPEIGLCEECFEVNAQPEPLRPANRKICKACGNFFVPSKIHPNLCICEQCLEEEPEPEQNGTENNYVTYKICEACGEVFLSSEDGADSSLCQNCSRNQQIYRPKRNIQQDIIKVCEECGNRFIPPEDNPNQDICDECVDDLPQTESKCACQRVTFSDPLELSICQCAKPPSRLKNRNQWTRKGTPVASATPKRLPPSPRRQQVTTEIPAAVDICPRCGRELSQCICGDKFVPKKPALVGNGLYENMEDQATQIISDSMWNITPQLTCSCKKSPRQIEMGEVDLICTCGEEPEQSHDVPIPQVNSVRKDRRPSNVSFSDEDENDRDQRRRGSPCSHCISVQTNMPLQQSPRPRSSSPKPKSAPPASRPRASRSKGSLQRPSMLHKELSTANNSPNVSRAKRSRLGEESASQYEQSDKNRRNNETYIPRHSSSSHSASGSSRESAKETSPTRFSTTVSQSQAKNETCCKACKSCKSSPLPSPKPSVTRQKIRTTSVGLSPVSSQKDTRGRQKNLEKCPPNYKRGLSASQSKKSCQCCTCTNCAIQTKRRGNKNARCQCCICENCGIQVTLDRNGKPRKPIITQWCQPKISKMKVTQKPVKQRSGKPVNRRNDRKKDELDYTDDSLQSISSGNIVCITPTKYKNERKNKYSSECQCTTSKNNSGNGPENNKSLQICPSVLKAICKSLSNTSTEERKQNRNACSPCCPQPSAGTFDQVVCFRIPKAVQCSVADTIRQSRNFSPPCCPPPCSPPNRGSPRPCLPPCYPPPCRPCPPPCSRPFFPPPSRPGPPPSRSCRRPPCRPGPPPPCYIPCRPPSCNPCPPPCNPCPPPCNPCPPRCNPCPPPCNPCPPPWNPCPPPCNPCPPPYNPCPPPPCIPCPPPCTTCPPPLCPQPYCPPPCYPPPCPPPSYPPSCIRPCKPPSCKIFPSCTKNFPSKPSYQLCKPLSLCTRCKPSACCVPSCGSCGSPCTPPPSPRPQCFPPPCSPPPCCPTPCPPPKCCPPPPCCPSHCSAPECPFQSEQPQSVPPGMAPQCSCRLHPPQSIPPPCAAMSSISCPMCNRCGPLPSTNIPTVCCSPVAPPKPVSCPEICEPKPSCPELCEPKNPPVPPKKSEEFPTSKCNPIPTAGLKCVSKLCKSPCAPKPPCDTPLCPSMEPSCKPCGDNSRNEPGKAYDTAQAHSGNDDVENPSKTDLEDDLSDSPSPSRSSFTPSDEHASCESLEYPCKPLKPRGAPSRNKNQEKAEENDQESFQGSSSEISFTCPSKKSTCPAKPALCPGAGNKPCPAVPPKPCPDRRTAPCADYTTADSKSRPKSKSSKSSKSKNGDCPGAEECPSKNPPPCPGRKLPSCCSRGNGKLPPDKENASICLPVAIYSSPPMQEGQHSGRTSDSSNISKEVASHEEVPSLSSNSQPTPSSKGDTAPRGPSSQPNVQIYMCTTQNPMASSEPKSTSEPNHCTCSLDTCKCSQTATHEEKNVQCPAFKQCTCQTEPKEDANVQCSCKEDIGLICKCGKQGCQCHDPALCKCKSGSSSSSGSTSSSDTLISCVCCKKEKILKNLMNKIPLCELCQQINQKSFYPYKYSNPLHSCLCYSLVDQDTLCQLKNTLTELERLDIYQQYCEVLKNCKCCKKCGCKCKLPKKFKNGCAYFLKLEDACPDTHCDHNLDRRDYNYEAYGEGEEDIEEEEEENYLPEVTVKVPNCKGRCAQRKKKSEKKSGTKKQISCPSIQTYLCALKPEFVERAERRRTLLRSATQEREEDVENRKLKFIDKVNYLNQKNRKQQYSSETNMYGPYGGQTKTYCVFDVEVDDAPRRIRPRVFKSFKEMQDLTRRRYLHLTEVRSKKDVHKEKRLREANRLLANTFTRRLQRSTLRGNVDIPPNVRVVSY